MKTSKTHLGIRLACLALLTFSLPTLAQPLHRLGGHVSQLGIPNPVEGALVSLDLNPADGSPESERFTDTFGFFELKNIPEGSYQLKVRHRSYLEYSETILIGPESPRDRVIRLLQGNAKVFFDVFIEVYGLATHGRLQGAEVIASYWAPDGTISGLPDKVFPPARTDALGKANLSGLEDGFYTFQVRKSGWETLTYTPDPSLGVIAGDKIRLIRTHLAAVFLRPVKTTLAVSVQGYDPVQDKPNKPLKDIVLQLTGYDFNVDEILIPTQTALTSTNGTYTFNNLVAVPHKLSIARLGYEPKEIILTPDANGHFAAVQESLALQPTKVKVVFESPYDSTDALEGAKVLLKGVRDSNAEGIERETDATVEEDGQTVSALFENLLPGRYWLHNVHTATLENLPNQSGPIMGPDAFEIAFFPKETYAEVSPGTTEEITLDLVPVPALVRGRLFATEEVGNMELEPCYSEPYRIFHQLPHDGIQFIEHEIVDLLDDDYQVISVDTDESGSFTALVTPGIFGLTIPTMTEYAGHNIEFGDLTEGQAPHAGPWPYQQEWPYNTWEMGHHGAGLRFDSGHEYQLDLFAHRHYVHIGGFVRTEEEPFGGLILRMNPDGTGVESAPYSYLSDTKTKVNLVGPSAQSVPISKDRRFMFHDVMPGIYQITIQHPDYETPPVSFSVAAWDAPGIPPRIAPYSDGYFFPGIAHCDGTFTMRSVWNKKGGIQIQRYAYSPSDKDYIKAGISRPQYFRVSGLENRLFSFSNSGSLPPGPYTIWMRHGDGWYSASGTGEQLFDGSIEGGSLDNTPPTNPPTQERVYTLDLHAVSSGDASMEIQGVTVEFPSGTPKQAGSEVAHEGTPYPNGATHNQQQWTYSFFPGPVVEVIDVDRRLIKVTVFMNRAMVVEGIVSTTTSTPIPGAAVVIRNRYGNPIGQAVSSATGTFSVGGLPPQPVYVDVNRRGFIPQRKRLTPPGVDNPDLRGQQFQLAPVPAPSVSEFTMNRFGMFLPGVTKSGDGNIPIIGGTRGFNPENGRRKLTVTWKVQASGQPYNFSLDGFVNSDESPKTPEHFDVQDEVAEVWVIDRRAFKEPLVNNPNQEDFQAVDPPNPLNYVTVREWLSKITAAKDDSEEPYYVVHRLETRARHSGPSPVEDAFQLWELPSGVFRPRVVVITHNGGVTVQDYELPQIAGQSTQPIYLQGMNVPQWLASALEVVGTMAVLPAANVDIVNKNYGDRFLKIGSASPKVEARIGVIPIENNVAIFNTSEDILERNLYLTYKYVIGVEMPLGETTPDGGALGLAPKFMGIKLDGVDAEFEVSGNERKACIALVFPAPSNVDTEELNKNYEPILVKKAKRLTDRIRFEDPDFKVTAKFGICKTLDADDLGRNRIGAYTLVLEAQGTVDFRVLADISDVIQFIPYGKPFSDINQAIGSLRSDGRKPLTINAVFESTIGGKFTVEITGEFPKGAGGGTVVRGGGVENANYNFAGGSEPQVPTLTTQTTTKIILRFAIGLNIDAGYGAVTGTGLIQVGAPKGASDTDGVFVTIDRSAPQWIKKVEGALSFVVRAGLNLYVTRINKSWQYDFITFVIDRGSEPSFFLTPLNVTTVMIDATTAPPQVFRGKDGTLVDFFFQAGSMDAQGGDEPLLAFTGTDPQTGHMTLLLSAKSGDQWLSPTQLTTSSGIVSLAVHPTHNGQWMTLWSELVGEDLFNPYPATTLKYSLSGDGGSVWKAPAELTTLTEAAFDLQLRATSDRTHAFFLATDQGPMAERRSLRVSTWDGTQWTLAGDLWTRETLASYDVASQANGRNAMAVIATAQGELWERRWDGTAWLPTRKIAEDADRQFAVRYDSTGRAILIWKGLDGLLYLASLDSGAADWSHSGGDLSAGGAQEIALQPMIIAEENLYAVVWSAGGEAPQLWSAWFDLTGAPRSEPRALTFASEAGYADIKLRALTGERVGVIAQEQGATTRIVELDFGLPTSVDCDGDGQPDEQAILRGLVADCNGNGIPDTCDIDAGLLKDRNRNRVADTCETSPATDCNGNGILDRDEILLGIAKDEDGDGHIDDCGGASSISVITIQSMEATRFYRAIGLHIRSEEVGQLEVEYQGALETAESLDGPWTLVDSP